MRPCLVARALRCRASMRSLCQVVLASLAMGSLVGCYDMHQGAGADASSSLDATSPLTPADVGLRDAGGPGNDALFLTDAALTCPLVRPDSSCLESFAIPAGVPSSLPYQFDGCGCCVDTMCAVEVDEAARVLRLTTTLCPDPCDCDACVIPRGTCDVPPLRALGEWTVETNGTAAFTVGVVEVSDPTFAPAPPGCATYAAIDGCGGAPPDFTTGPERGAVCLIETSNGQQALTLTQSCTSCGELNSACDTLVVPRLTDDLPQGADITLHARDYATSCDVDCPGECIPHVRTCALPPLVLGDFYRVRVDGEVIYTFRYGEALEPCPRR